MKKKTFQNIVMENLDVTTKRKKRTLNHALHYYIKV